MENKRKMRVVIANDSERENVFAEIWFEDLNIAEITSERSKLEIEFFDIKGKLFDLEDLLNVINLAQSKLI